MFIITVKARDYRFATLAEAQAKAEAIFAATGIIVGIRTA